MKIKSIRFGRGFPILKCCSISILITVLVYLFLFGFHKQSFEQPKRKLSEEKHKKLLAPSKDQTEPEELFQDYEKYIDELELINPGEFGAAVELRPNLSSEIKKKIADGYSRHGFNAFVSNLISLDRKLIDSRSEECKRKIYTNLPKCSIVIPFHNEEWSLLLRTVHSIVNRSPDELVDEILLIDDASDRGERWRCLL